MYYLETHSSSIIFLGEILFFLRTQVRIMEHTEVNPFFFFFLREKESRDKAKGRGFLPCCFNTHNEMLYCFLFLLLNIYTYVIYKCDVLRIYYIPGMILNEEKKERKNKLFLQCRLYSEAGVDTKMNK